MICPEVGLFESDAENSYTTFALEKKLRNIKGLLQKLFIHTVILVFICLNGYLYAQRILGWLKCNSAYFYFLEHALIQKCIITNEEISLIFNLLFHSNLKKLETFL